ncbi:MAG: hypothetical protein IJ008_00725 [Clostridia bacterium]|nr:hypothetical protein [Clostridia bacterium]
MAKLNELVGRTVIRNENLNKKEGASNGDYELSTRTFKVYYASENGVIATERIYNEDGTYEVQPFIVSYLDGETESNIKKEYLTDDKWISIEDAIYEGQLNNNIYYKFKPTKADIANGKENKIYRIHCVLPNGGFVYTVSDDRAFEASENLNDVIHTEEFYEGDFKILDARHGDLTLYRAICPLSEENESEQKYFDKDFIIKVMSISETSILRDAIVPTVYLNEILKNNSNNVLGSTMLEREKNHYGNNDYSHKQYEYLVNVYLRNPKLCSEVYNTYQDALTVEQLVDDEISAVCYELKSTDLYDLYDKSKTSTSVDDVHLPEIKFDELEDTMQSEEGLQQITINKMSQDYSLRR